MRDYELQVGRSEVLDEPPPRVVGERGTDDATSIAGETDEHGDEAAPSEQRPQEVTRRTHARRGR